MNIDVAKFRKFAPSLTAEQAKIMVDALNKELPRWNITTPRRIRYFLTHCFAETMGFTKLQESLFYTTAARIVAVWPSRFNLSGTSGKLNANNYLRNSVKLANEVYANRYGNGNASSGDGAKYLGRGFMHLTFKDNYKRASLAIYEDERLVQNPELVSSDLSVAVATACWFWKTNGLNELADADEFTATTKKVNGSTRPVQERVPILRNSKMLVE